jgi:hypothetical protein
MTVAIESVLLLLAGISLAIFVSRALSRGTGPAPADGAPAVQLVRTARTAEGLEETRLAVNDQVIVAASNDGIRLAEYADEVEQLEAVAARLARALGSTVQFVRLNAGAEMAEGIAMRTLPRTTDEEADERSPRRPRHTDTGAG